MSERRSIGRGVAFLAVALAAFLVMGDVARAGDAFFSATLSSSSAKVIAQAGSITTIPVVVTNTSATAWSESGDNTVYLSYRLHSQSGAMLDGMGAWTNLVPGMAAGESRVVNMLVYVPQKPGNYKIVVDLIRGSDRVWFSDRGNGALQIGLAARHKG